MILTPGQFHQAFGTEDSSTQIPQISPKFSQNENYRWRHGVIPYKFKRRSFSPQGKNDIRNVIKWINEDLAGCIYIRKATRADKDFVTITAAHAGDGCHAAVGKWGGEQLLILNKYCLTNSKDIAHEFMHAFGFWHEHQRPDR